jgi:hypothetical protein
MNNLLVGTFIGFAGTFIGSIFTYPFLQILSLMEVAILKHKDH